MKIKDVLSEYEVTKLYKLVQPHKKHDLKKNKPIKENLSFKEIKSLMGVYRDRYGRGRGGAMKKL